MRRRYRPKPKKKVVIRYKVNEQIKAPRVLVVADKEKIGEMNTTEAIALAQEKGLDLVEVSPRSNPPVCKIIDYGKFQYLQTKQQNRNSKQKKTETKGIRLGLRTGEHDFNFKLKQAEKFLLKGHKVKIELRLKGRERAHQDLAKENLKQFIDKIEIPTKVEEEIKKFPGGFNIIISAN